MQQQINHMRWQRLCDPVPSGRENNKEYDSWNIHPDVTGKTAGGIDIAHELACPGDR